MPTHKRIISKPRRIEDGVYSVNPGINTRIHEVIPAAAELAGTLEAGTVIRFTFIFVEMSVCSDSNQQALLRDWLRALYGLIPDLRVGPYPNAVLSEAERDSDSRINKQQRLAAEERRNLEELNSRNIHALLSHAPPIAIADTATWESISLSNRGSVIIHHATIWARLTQLAMVGDVTFEIAVSCAQEKMNKAGLDLSGAAHFRVVRTLVRCWKYGEQFRLWHNTTTSPGPRGALANKRGEIINASVV